MKEVFDCPLYVHVVAYLILEFFVLSFGFGVVRRCCLLCLVYACFAQGLAKG